MSSDRIRNLRAVLRNAVTWGAAWATLGGALVGGVALFSPDPRIESLPERLGLAVASAVMYGIRFGIIGAVIGGAFAGVIRFGYRGRRLADISAVRFGLLGAAVGGVGVPLFLQTMNVLSGDGPVAWGLVTDDSIWASLFGGAAAAGSILLAKRAGALPAASQPHQLRDVDDVGAPPAADAREAALTPRTRATTY